MKKNLFTAGLLLATFPSFGLAAGLDNIVKGPPALMTQVLAPTGYGEQTGRKLARPRLMYINYELLTEKLREEGVAIPETGIPEALKKEFLDEVAYIIPHPADPKDAFLETAKKFFSDRYGGLGMNGNYGSGRATSIGKVQLKGPGPTTLIGKNADPSHATGALHMSDGIHEAIWGEVVSHEYPYGGNRTLAIIDTGLVDENGHPRALTIREDPLRPAHFMRNDDATREIPELENARMKNALANLDRALPQPLGVHPTTRYDRIESGLNEFIDRVAKQYAAAYAKSMYHGATSPSNILLDGKMIDFATQTAMAGYQKLQMLDEAGEGPNGSPLPQKTELFHDILENLRANLPDDLKGAVPPLKKAYRRYDAAVTRAVDREFLNLAGVPTEFQESLANTPEGRRFAKVLKRVASAGNDQVLVRAPSGDTGKYNLGRVLARLVAEPEAKVTALSSTLEAELGNDPLKRELAEAYARYRPKLAEMANASGIKPAALKTYERAAISIRNKKMPELIMHHENNAAYHQQVWELVDKSQKENDPMLIQNYIDGRVARNRRTFHDAGPFEVVLDETVDPVSGRATRRVFDAKAGEFRLVERTSYGHPWMPGVPVELPSACPGKFGHVKVSTR